ncbi:MAG: hypothetical protein J7L31_04925 [Thermoplasmata archaeon]|nr:hypothetical protein [Thermoplasmata archaeon]
MYKIPKEEEVRKALYAVLKKYGYVSSLKKLRDEMAKELKKMDSSYRLSMRRARIIAARSGFVRVEVKKGKGKMEGKNCPVCGNKMKPIRSISLLGEKVVLGYKCGLCGYSGKMDEMPVKYEFHLTR